MIIERFAALLRDAFARVSSAQARQVRDYQYELFPWHDI